MNSPFANIFLALQQLVQAQVTDIVYIDQDLGQLQPGKNTTRPAVQFPCLLIDFDDFNYQDMGNLVQSVEGTVVLKLGFAPYSNSSSSTPGTYVQKAIGYYDIEWALHKALQGWSPGADYGSLIRSHTYTLKRTDNIRVREIRYRIAFQDFSTKPVLQNVAATLVPTLEVHVTTS